MAHGLCQIRVGENSYVPETKVPKARKSKTILTLPSPSASGKRGSNLQVLALIQ